MRTLSQINFSLKGKKYKITLKDTDNGALRYYSDINKCFWEGTGHVAAGYLTGHGSLVQDLRLRVRRMPIKAERLVRLVASRGLVKTNFRGLR